LTGAAPAPRSASGANEPAIAPKAFGLRARLIVVVLLALVPFALMLAWNGLHKLRDVRLEAEASVLAAAREAALQQQDILDTARNTLAVLSQAQSVRLFEEQRCRKTLQAVEEAYGWMASLYVLDPAGGVHCTGDRPTGEVNLVSDPVFQQAIETGALQVGDFQIGRFSRLPVVPVVLPNYDDDGHLLFFIATSIKLQWTSALLAKAHLPEGSVAIVLEDDGTVLSQAASPATTIGQIIADKTFLHALTVQPEGVVEMAGIDAVERFYGYDHIDPGGAIAIVGIPREIVLAPVREWIIDWLGALLLSIAFSVPLAWLAADRLVLRTAQRIAMTARQLAQGDADARTGLSSAPCELGELARQFDEMAEHLARKGKELQLAYQMARDADRAKSSFLAKMSHELRTPLNAISGFSQIIRDQRFGPGAISRYSEYADDIATSSDHLLSMINHILDHARVEANSVELRPEEIPVASLLTEATRLLSHMAQANQVRLNVGPCESGLTLIADRTAMRQILLNLVSNAIKYTPAGGQVLLRAAAQDGGIAIEILDSGIGMSHQDIERAFLPFGRIDDPFVRSREGVGLGLPIVKGLVDLHQGRIAIDSEPNRGTRVRLWLPRDQAANREAADSPDALRQALAS